MDDKLAERGRALVAVAAVHHEQPAQVFELGDGEVCSQGSLLAFLKPAQNWAPSETREVKANTCFVSFFIEKARQCKEISGKLQRRAASVSSCTREVV